MGYYLLDHPPASSQYRNPRRLPLSGVVVVHTAEGAADTVGADTGAENVASFISRRPDPGSYHVLCDSDSTVDLVPDSFEAFHVAADGANQHSWGISAACRTTDWSLGDPWTDATLARMGAAIAAFYRRNGWDPAAVRWGTRQDSLNRRGPVLVTHGDLQPADRTDAWNRHPQRAGLEAALLAHVHGTPAAPGKVPRMLDTTTILGGPYKGRGVEARAFLGSVCLRWQTEPGGTWTAFEWLGDVGACPTPCDSVSIRSNLDGPLAVIAWASQTGESYTAWQSDPGGSWNGWLGAW